jgi:hypothetical protein
MRRDIDDGQQKSPDDTGGDQDHWSDILLFKRGTEKSGPETQRCSASSAAGRPEQIGLPGNTGSGPRQSLHSSVNNDVAYLRSA